MPNRKAIILLVVLAVMLILTIGLIFAGKAFFGILTAVIAGIFAKSTDASKKIGEVIKTEKERSKERQKQAGQLNQQADNWEEKNKRRRQGKLGKPPNINVILLLFVILVGSVSAAGGLYIPKNYNELKALYIDADRALQDGKKIIDQYKNLYSGAEASNKKITDELADAKLIIDSQNKALAAAKVTMEQQDKTIADLRRPRWGITGGADINGDGIGWDAGIIKRNDWWGWQTGYSSANNTFNAGIILFEPR